MKQKEKSTNTKIKILNAALKEFSTNSYEKSSINKICKNGHIAKGVMYHYFKNKDELYLYCVQYCYKLIIEYYKNSLKECDSWKSGIENFFKIRYSLFLENPEITKVFFFTIFHEPEHLSEYIKKIRQELENISYNYFTNILNKMNLRKGITVDEIISVIGAIENTLNQTFKMDENNSDDIEKLIFKYEETIKKYGDILLFGILEQK